MKRTRTRIFAAAAMVVSAVALAPSPASAATCRTIVDNPETTVIVAGQPVATVPRIYLALCGEIGLSPGSLPTLRIEQNAFDPSIVGVFLDFPADFYLEDLSLRYSIDDLSGDIPLPIPDISGPAALCVFYTGPSSMNPGGCLLGLDRG